MSALKQGKVRADRKPGTGISSYPDVHRDNGLEYVKEAVYMQMSGYAYSALKSAREDGLPFLPVQHGKREIRYYNLEECRAWHAGI